MSKALTELLDLLALEKIDPGLYLGRSQDLGFRSVFGGQVMGQALSAAKDTVEPDRRCHSLHAYFLRPGNPQYHIVYDVENIRDGQTISTRRVRAVQHGKPIFYLTASFQMPMSGFEHQAVQMPQVKGPDGLLCEQDIARQHQDKIPERLITKYLTPRPIEIRPVEIIDVIAPKVCDGVRMNWMKANGSMPKDERVHKYVLAYASDFNFLLTALQPHGLSVLDPNLQIATIDHSMWFHHNVCLDDWLLYVMESPITCSGRGLVKGHIFNAGGQLVATTIQEGIMRRRNAET